MASGGQGQGAGRSGGPRLRGSRWVWAPGQVPRRMGAQGPRLELRPGPQEAPKARCLRGQGEAQGGVWGQAAGGGIGWWGSGGGARLGGSQDTSEEQRGPEQRSRIGESPLAQRGRPGSPGWEAQEPHMPLSPPPPESLGLLPLHGGTEFREALRPSGPANGYWPGVGRVEGVASMAGWSRLPVRAAGPVRLVWPAGQRERPSAES